jgi:predicted O-methyltransferase YrrM
MIFFRLFNYLKYILLSGHRKGHGIHSPFVFNIVSRIFRNKIDPGIVCSIEIARQKMISDQRILKVNDLGTGSEKLKTNRRKVSDIARNSPVPSKYGKLLYNMAAEFGYPYTLELGTSVGISTMYLAMGNNKSEVITIEGSSEIAEIAAENISVSGLTNVEIVCGSFDEKLPQVLGTKKTPGLVFIDGNHRKEPVLKYFNSISSVADSSTVIIIDDIYYSKEMAEAWKCIKKSDNVSVTIDLNRLGIVFFRTGINHNDYIIRY